MRSVPPDMNAFRGRTITDLCRSSLAQDANRNHCAHFVSHVMEYELPGATCRNISFNDRRNLTHGATIRVDDIFNRCHELGPWSVRPASLVSCLMFVTVSRNIRRQGSRITMGTHQNKHIGILWNNRVWNYANALDKVVDETEQDFITRLTAAYGGSGTVVFYYGRFLV